VQAGEPVGVMPVWNPLTLIHHPSLMLELRRDGQATNPAPLLRAKG
jgi:septal ring factor EnvC (AmiA/AmiB activator)